MPSSIFPTPTWCGVRAWAKKRIEYQLSLDDWGAFAEHWLATFASLQRAVTTLRDLGAAVTAVVGLTITGATTESAWLVGALALADVRFVSSPRLQPRLGVLLLLLVPVGGCAHRGRAGALAPGESVTVPAG